MDAEGKIKVVFNGKLQDATRVPVVRTNQEAWSEYLLDDGTIIRMKIVITDVLRIDGVYDGDGNPVYQIKSGNVASSIPPEQLRRLPGRMP
jgi:hypothetical protein